LKWALRETGANFIEDPPKGPIGRLLNPNSNFCKSKEGVEEYKKAGLKYPDNHYDKHYADFIERTPTGKGNEYTSKNKTRITDITRFMLRPEKEYLIWSGLARYPIIEMKNIMQEEESGYRHVVTEPSGNTRTGYSMPYTVENIDKLHKNANDDYEFEEITGKEVRPTHYHLYDARKRTSVTIKEWENFRDGDFSQLYEYGKKITSEEEAKAI
jgi:hypothetical protein